MSPWSSNYHGRSGSEGEAMIIHKRNRCCQTEKIEKKSSSGSNDGSENEDLSSRVSQSKSWSSHAMFDSRMIPDKFLEGYGAILDTFTEHEKPHVKTWSRIVVEKYLSKVSCHFFPCRSVTVQYPQHAANDYFILWSMLLVFLVLSKKRYQRRLRTSFPGQGLGLLRAHYTTTTLCRPFHGRWWIASCITRRQTRNRAL